MTVTLELEPEIEAKVQQQAEAEGMSVETFLHNLIAERVAPEVRDGASLVSYWRREGLIGTRPDIEDSSAHARKLRSQAEARTRD